MIIFNADIQKKLHVTRKLNFRVTWASLIQYYAALTID